MSHTPNALAATIPTSPHGRECAPEAPAPAPDADFITPRPIASTTMPRTSSITALAIIVTPSRESIFLRSDRILAVIPTDVAVPSMPMNRAGGENMERLSNIGIGMKWCSSVSPSHGSGMDAHQLPRRNETTTPPTPIISPANEYLRNILKLVSTPDRNKSTTEAIVHIP